MKNLKVVLSVVLVAGAVVLTGRDAAFGYAGEPGSGTGNDQTLAQLRVSTHHTHLTRALAYCAGFDALLDVVNPVNPLVNPQTAPIAEQLAIYDELTDQGTLKGKDKNGVAVEWKNWNTTSWSFTMPPSTEMPQCTGQTLAVVYPIMQPPPNSDLPPESFFNPTNGWFTNRFGPWATQFHFPRTDATNDLQVMRDFAYNTTNPTAKLSARSVYAYGGEGTNLWSAGCYSPLDRRENISTGDVVKAGSVAAFATYLHSLGDSYSHKVCADQWQATGATTPPWYYHSPLNEPAFVPGCGFNDHVWEFGCPASAQRAAFIGGTVKGGQAVFNELVAYAKSKNLQPRLSSADKYSGWLTRQLERYAMLYQNNTNETAGRCRVYFTYHLMNMCKTIAENPANACFDDVTVTETECPAAGRTQGCENGNDYYPMQGSCESTAAQSKTAP
jgi:hypothetical protein